MIVLDASALIGFLDGADPHHGSAVALLRDAADQELATSVITLAEVLVVPARRHRLDVALEALRALEVRELGLPPSSPVGLARLGAESGLRLPDCCVLLTAQAQDAALATYDARLGAVATERGVTVLGG